MVPARVLDTADHHEPVDGGTAVIQAAGCVAGLDLVRGADGVLRVLEDNFRTPSGIAYAAAAREAVDPELPRPCPARSDPSAAFDLLASALRAAAPDGADDPFVVLLSDGPSNSAWWEHREIARRTGIPMVNRDDLSPGRRAPPRPRGRLACPPGGRGLPAHRRGPAHATSTVAPPGSRRRCCDPVRKATVAVVNPLGSGVADDKLAHAYVEDMVRFYLARGAADRVRAHL